MPQLSQRKRDKITEQILHFLFTIAPESRFTAEISVEIARDEEFTLSLLRELEKKNLVISLDKNKDGLIYLKRRRWRLSNEVYKIYRERQPANHNNLYNEFNI